MAIKKGKLTRDLYIFEKVILKNIIVIFILLLLTPCMADDREEDHEEHNIIELKNAGKITSLEDILMNLSSHHIERILEIELKHFHNKHDKQLFVYEIEYINDAGIVMEIEVNALTAQVLKLEREY